MAKEMMNFNLPTEGSSIIKVIGVGGGGSNAVNHMYRQGIRGVDFVVCNTDQQALDMSPVPKKIALGSSLTEGRGAGAQAEVGRNAAIENLDDIKEVLSNGTKMVFITAGMGGGTGTGAAPVIAQAAREQGILTVGIVTIPFGFEGKKRKIQANLGLEELKKHVDTVLIISNDKLRMYGNLKLSEAFSQADDVLTIAAKGIAEIITVEGYVNVDFEDVRTVMTNSGVAIMGSATTSGPDRAIKAVEQALASPLLNDNNIYGASNILLYISSGREEVTMDEVAEITDYIQEEAGMEADVIWGNGTDDDLGDQLTLTIVATGFSGEKLEKVTGNESVIKHVLDPRSNRTETQTGRTDAHRSSATDDKNSIPTGLTARPVLMNDRLKADAENVKTEPQLRIPPPMKMERKTEEPQMEHIIRHSLVDDARSSTIMAYKLDETDEEVTNFLEMEAPEMTGVLLGEELPMYDEEEEDNIITTSGFGLSFSTNSTPTFTEEPTNDLEDEVAEEPETQPFMLFNTTSISERTPDLFGYQDQEDELDTDSDIIHSEKPTEIEFELKPTVAENEEDVKKFSLYEDDFTKPVSSEMDELTEEPQLITRNTPIENRVENAFDMEDMQRRQQERLERLKNISKRFNSPSSLSELENIPAYKRRNVNLDDQPHSSESSVSRFGVSDSDQNDDNGNKRGVLSDANEFLHQSVD